MTSHPLTVPNLDLPGVRLLLSAWLVGTGGLVVEGDRVVEILAGEATVDLESPATGILAEKRAAVADVLAVGQVIGMVISRE